MVMLDGHYPTIRTTLSDLGDIWTIAAPYNVAMGVLLGVGLALFDWLHNRRRSAWKTASTLLLNLWWCGLYVTTLNALNALFALAVVRMLPSTRGWSWQVLVPLFAVAILNLSAILWASIRSVTKSVVLSPGVLGSKLKRSARIQG